MMEYDQQHSLLIMRHAKSNWDAGVRQDFDRPLADRGADDAGRIASWMCAQKIVPGLIISSPAKRTHDTAVIVAQRLEINPDNILWEDTLYEATLNDLLQVIATHAAEPRQILLIGHNPGLDTLLCYLAREEPVRTGSGKLMTTSALAILDFGSSAVSSTRHSASLKKLLRPKELPG